MLAAPREKLLAALSELYLKTAKAGSTDDDFKARMQIYARDLAAYPGDVTISILRGWRSTFFPTFGEICDVIEADGRIAERRTRIKALELFLAGRQDEKPKGKAVTDEFIEKMRAKYRPRQSASADMVTADDLEIIRRVDEAIGDKARVNNGRWRPLSELARQVSLEASHERKARP